MQPRQRLAAIRNACIKIQPISTNHDWPDMVFNWLSDESSGLMAICEAEKEYILGRQQYFHIVVYECGMFTRPIGVFSLADVEVSPDIQATLGERALGRVLDLDYFYITEEMRGAGIGGLVMRRIKEMAQREGAELLTLGTLSPRLNAFYERNGAKVVSDRWYNRFDQEQMNDATYFRMELAPSVADDVLPRFSKG